MTNHSNPAQAKDELDILVTNIIIDLRDAVNRGASINGSAIAKREIKALLAQTAAAARKEGYLDGKLEAYEAADMHNLIKGSHVDEWRVRIYQLREQMVALRAARKEKE